MVKYIINHINRKIIDLGGIFGTDFMNAYSIPGGLTDWQTKRGSNCERPFYRKTYSYGSKTSERRQDRVVFRKMQMRVVMDIYSSGRNVNLPLIEGKIYEGIFTIDSSACLLRLHPVTSKPSCRMHADNIFMWLYL